MSFKPYINNQVFSSLKSRCLSSNQLFNDDTFPANDKSLSRSGKKLAKQRISWKRASEIVQNPQFVVNNIAPNDLDQGQIGDCWLITGLAAVATIPEYISVTVPMDQSFDSSDYAGIFHFRFWRFGEFVDVVIDDFLPVGEQGQLLFCHNNQDANEMFGPLMEKAYAKLNGCYQYLDGGEAVDAMIDLTGGVHESFQVKYNPIQQKTQDSVDDGTVNMEPDQLWEVMYKSYMMKSLAGASIKVGQNNSMEHVEASGLVQGHAYCIMDVYEIMSNGQLREGLAPINDRTTRLLRMRNPWGQSKSWNGRWSAGSSEWRSINPNILSRIQANEQTDGIFFIAFDDFVRSFDDLDYVHVNMDAFYESDTRQAQSPLKWVNQSYYGEFVPGKNAGGCGNDDPRNYWINPQYSLHIDTGSSGKKTSVIVSLMQTEQTRLKDKNGGIFEKSNEALGFSVYLIVDKNDANVQKKFSQGYKFKEQELDECCSSGAYRITREVSKRFLLAPGNYVIIPSLFDKDVPMKFLMRVFTKSTTDSSQPNTNIRVVPPPPVNNNNNDDSRRIKSPSNNYHNENADSNRQEENNEPARNDDQYYGGNNQDNGGYGRDRDEEQDDDRRYGSRGHGRDRSRDRSRDNSRDRRDSLDRRDDDREGSRPGRGRRSKNFTRPTVDHPDPMQQITKVVSKACSVM